LLRTTAGHSAWVVAFQAACALDRPRVVHDRTLPSRAALATHRRLLEGSASPIREKAPPAPVRHGEQAGLHTFGPQPWGQQVGVWVNAR